MSIKADDLTIPGRLRMLSAERGEQTAVQALPDGGRLTFRTWDQRSDEAAHGLAALGVMPGDRVLLPVATDWICYAVAYAAIAKSGATAVPVLTSHGDEHVRWAQASAAAVGMISDQPIAGCGGWARSLAELENGAKAPLNVTIREHDDAQIIFTSGTTGRPKGVVATHENILRSLCRHPAAAAKVVLHSVPAATNAGLGLLVQPLGNTPHTVIALPEFRPEEFLEEIERQRPTDIVLVPTMALALLRAQEAARRDLSSVRMVRTMSAPISPASLERLDAMFPNAATVNMYASTESWPARRGPVSTAPVPHRSASLREAPACVSSTRREPRYRPGSPVRSSSRSTASPLAAISAIRRTPLACSWPTAGCAWVTSATWMRMGSST